MCIGRAVSQFFLVIVIVVTSLIKFMSGVSGTKTTFIQISHIQKGTVRHDVVVGKTTYRKTQIVAAQGLERAQKKKSESTAA
jgi:hypothetical protein